MMDDNNLGPEVDERVTLDTKPVTITVKPLPENKPANYNGAVGSFSIETSLANRSVAAQDEATLHVVVKGKGNLPVLAAPTIAWPSGFEAFEPTAKEDVNKTVAPMSGSKSFDYVFIPRTPGHYTLPAVSFSYFDPSSQTYKSAEGEPQDLQVTPAVSQHRQTVGARRCCLPLLFDKGSCWKVCAGPSGMDLCRPAYFRSCRVFLAAKSSSEESAYDDRGGRSDGGRRSQEKETSEKGLTGKGCGKDKNRTGFPAGFSKYIANE